MIKDSIKIESMDSERKKEKKKEQLALLRMPVKSHILDRLGLCPDPMDCGIDGAVE